MKLWALLSLMLANLMICTLAKNPFKGKRLYVNPSFRQNVNNTMSKLSPGDPDYNHQTLMSLKIARDTSTVIWLRSVQQVQPNNTDVESMKTVLMDAAKEPGTLVVFAINNIPTDKCAENLETYKKSFIDNIVDLVDKYKKSVSISFIIEPNAVASLVTDTGNPVCEDAETQKATWKEAVVYAVSEINKHAPELPLYLGLGHSEWLGSDKKSKIAADVVRSWKIVDQIRGFATNIGNYQPVGLACCEALFCVPSREHDSEECCASACESTAEYHDNNELNYALRIESYFPGKKFVIDTGRNGVSNARSSCSNWCNVRNAGLGLLPTADTQIPLIDAYLWIHPPGRSSGCTETLPTGNACKSFKSKCASVDSVGSAVDEPRMPEDGVWSDYLMTQLAREATFGSAVIPRPPSSTVDPIILLETPTPCAPIEIFFSS